MLTCAVSWLHIFNHNKWTCLVCCVLPLSVADLVVSIHKRGFYALLYNIKYWPRKWLELLMVVIFLVYWWLYYISLESKIQLIEKKYNFQNFAAIFKFLGEWSRIDARMVRDWSEPKFLGTYWIDSLHTFNYWNIYRKLYFPGSTQIIFIIELDSIKIVIVSAEVCTLKKFDNKCPRLFGGGHFEEV